MTPKQQLIQVFNFNATAYNQYRPKYPPKLIEDLIELSGIQSHDSILEVGCGTGQITVDFLKRGFHLTAIEKGAKLAEIASNNIATYPNGQVICADFEEWQTSNVFQLFVCAQAFHWIDKERGITKVLHLLERGGSIGLIWHVDVSQETDFWKESTKVYAKYLPTSKPQKKLKSRVEEYRDYLQGVEEFTALEVRTYPWTKTYSKDAYLGLLSTFSGHGTLEESKRKAFFRDMENLIETAFDNQVEKHYRTGLVFGKKC